MSSFQFQAAALQNAEKNFKQVKLDPQKRQIINGVVEIISKYVSINEMALRGFILFAVKETQQELQVELKNMDQMTPLDKKQFIQAVFSKVGQKLEKILISKKDADIATLHKALEEALKYRLSQQ